MAHVRITHALQVAALEECPAATFARMRSLMQIAA
jgi:hypothetical protein